LTEARNALQIYRTVMADAPDAFACYPAAFRIPPIDAFPEEHHGQVALNLILAHMGDVEEGKRVAKPLRELGEPIMDLCAPQPYAEHLKVFDAGTPPGQRWYSRGQYMDDISDEAINAFIDHAANTAGSLTFAYFEPLGGAAGGVPPEATAFPHRDAAYSFHILAGWMDSGEDPAVMQWVRDFHHAMEPFASDAVYVNLLAEDEPGQRGLSVARLCDQNEPLARLALEVALEHVLPVRGLAHARGERVKLDDRPEIAGRRAPH